MASAPYVIGQWVRGEKFYGRAAFLDDILRGDHDWIWLLGTRRVGKTSVLKQLEWLTASNDALGYFPVFWDFQGSDDSGELHNDFVGALLDAEDRLELLGISPSELQSADLFESIGRLRRKLRASNQKLLLLCDETEKLIDLHRKDPSLLSRLRRAFQSQEGIRTVMASTIRLWALSEQTGDTSPFLHGLTPPRYIQRLTDPDALDLIRQTHLRGDSRPDVDDSAAETIRGRCDNHPFLLQLMSKSYLELGDLDEATERVATGSTVDNMFSFDVAMLSPQDREVLRVVAESTASHSNSIQQRISADADSLANSVHRLEDLGYLRRDAQRRFELANYFFRRWFAKGSNPRMHDGPISPSETTTAPNMEGVVGGRYQLLEKIGTGMTGVVWRAEDEKLHATIAIKILKNEYSAHPEALERLRQEILLSRDIAHPNIVRMYDLGEAAGRRFITMQWISGTSLAEALRRHGAMPVTRVIEVGRKLAAALEASHERRVLHRDIKPQNVLLDEAGEPYLSDFGLARLMGGPSFTRSGVFLGTPDYASPEQASLQRLDERSDLYSLGVVIFEMATGRRPFAGDSLEELLEHHRSSSPPDPRSIRPELPYPLARLILRCLEKSAGRRYQSARLLRLGLEEIPT